MPRLLARCPDLRLLLVGGGLEAGNIERLVRDQGLEAVVLLTGRPSRLPAVRSIVEEMLVVPPHRLISMHKYKTGRWYPFRDPVTIAGGITNLEDIQWFSKRGANGQIGMSIYTGKLTLDDCFLAQVDF